MNERRKDLRVPVRREVRWDGFSASSSAVTSDISLGGCYIESLCPVAIGDVLDFDFRLASSEWLRVRGQVMYLHQNIGFGVRFTDLNARQQILALLVVPSASANEPRDTPGNLAA